MGLGSSGRRRARRLGVAILLLGLAAAPSAQARIYWSNFNNPNTIGRAELDGTGANKSFITGVQKPYGVAVDGAHVYWINNNTNAIGRANLDGTGVNQSFIPTSSRPIGVAVDGAHLYWTNYNAGGIGRANLDGTGVNQSFITGASGPSGVAVDRAYVYWTNDTGGSIGRAALNGTATNQSFITGANEPYGVAIDGAHVYWANFGTNAIGRANLDGTAKSQSFITGAKKPFGVAVDGAHVYWPNYTGNAIGRAALDGTGANQSFIAGANGPSGVAVDPPAGGSGGGGGGEKGGPGGTLVSLRGYGLSRSTFAAASKGASVASAARRRKPKVGTRVSYTLSEPATVRFTVERAAKGRRVQGKCRKPTRKNRRRKRCVRYRGLRGSFEHSGQAGRNSFKFTGRLRGRKLRPGRYRLVARARDAAGNKSKPKRVRFRIVR